MTDISKQEAREALRDMIGELEAIDFKLTHNYVPEGTMEWKAWFIMSLFVRTLLTLVLAVLPLVPEGWDGHYLRKLCIDYAADGWTMGSWTMGRHKHVAREFNNWWAITYLPHTCYPNWLIGDTTDDGE